MASVAVIQMNAGPDVAANLKDAAGWLKLASDQGAELAVLPECFSCLEGNLKALGMEEGRSSTVQQFLSDQSRALGLWIIGGTTPCSSQEPTSDERHFASCFVYDPEGRQQARYNKMHLFDVEVADGKGTYRESDSYRHGDQVVSVETAVGKVGLSVCYDLRFPELYRVLSAQDADIFTVPAAFTRVTGEAHWEVLLRARAIENQCFVMAANQCGHHGKSRETWGHSMIIDPWGDILAEAGDEPGIIMAELDMARLAEVRRQMPCLSHRRIGAK
ncbi:carbon-nitrogen hydrolase family protein [Kistimonas scapharcae]|uniref:Carbon-nitrogen hydrolase family protein n=1 Tax=Kistimonas scapharcae TaxID=1036133 RepID=A0ABP8UW27_9GAMM